MATPCPVAARESSRRLAELLRHERADPAPFLVALAGFDRERVWLQLGHASLFSYLHRELRLPHAAAHYRKVAVGLIQDFPEVVEPLRQGKLCLPGAADLARVMTPENRHEVLPRFFHRSRPRPGGLEVRTRLPLAIPRRDPGASAHGSSQFRPDETGRCRDDLDGRPRAGARRPEDAMARSVLASDAAD
jgi:hypothetical protein